MWRNIIKLAKSWVKVNIFKKELPTDPIPKNTPYCYDPESGKLCKYYLCFGEKAVGCEYCGYIVNWDPCYSDQCKVCDVKSYKDLDTWEYFIQRPFTWDRDCILDKDGVIVLESLDHSFENSCGKLILDTLNKECHIDKIGINLDSLELSKSTIYLDSKPVLVIKGWERLEESGLSLEEILEVQDKFSNKLVDNLKNYDREKRH